MFHWLVHLSGPFCSQNYFHICSVRGWTWLLKVKNREHLKLSFLSASKRQLRLISRVLWLLLWHHGCFFLSFFFFLKERKEVEDTWWLQNPIRVCVHVGVGGVCLGKWSNWTERKEGCCCASLNPSSSWIRSILFLKCPWTHLWISSWTGRHQTFRVSFHGLRWSTVKANADGKSHQKTSAKSPSQAV